MKYNLAAAVAISVLALAVMTSTMIIPAMAKTSGGNSASFVSVNTGNRNLDMRIHLFVDCFLKFSHPDPNSQQVRDCFDKVFGSTHMSSSNSDTVKHIHIIHTSHSGSSARIVSAFASAGGN